MSEVRCTVEVWRKHLPERNTMSYHSDQGRAERAYYTPPDDPEDETEEAVYDTDEDWRFDK